MFWINTCFWPYCFCIWKLSFMKNCSFSEEATSYSLCQNKFLSLLERMKGPRVTWRRHPRGSLVWKIWLWGQPAGCSPRGLIGSRPSPPQQPFLLQVYICCLLKAGHTYKPLQRLFSSHKPRMASEMCSWKWTPLEAAWPHLHWAQRQTSGEMSSAEVFFSKLQWPTISDAWGKVSYDEEQLQMTTAPSKGHSYGN